MSFAEEQLEEFFDKYTPEIADQGRRALARLREFVPGAVEMVYDNYNGLVIGFCPDDKPSNAVLSILLAPRWVTLCFLQGVSIPDPKGLLKGEGNLVRSLRLIPLELLENADVQALIQQALASAKVPIDPSGESRLVIKSISAKQRPRRSK
ncbi:MAG: DUF1801 domain-containing protein [Armatimonadetes bacterium]|nr:DUF1801 domain-containing protein [Armatimonadota bacterium]